MKFFDTIRAAAALVPELSQDETLLAVDAAGRSVTLEELQRLCRNINASFHNYMRAQLWYVHAAGGTASAGAKRLKRIAEQTTRLIEALGACGDYSPRGEAAALCLAREANTHGERIGGYPGLPPREFVAVSTEEAPIVRRLALYYRGEEKVEEIIGGLSLLRDLAEAAYRYERAKVEKSKTDTKRHPGDPAMFELFCELDCAWRYAFGDVPGASIPHGGGPAGGPYVRFVSTLLETYREKIPAKTDIYTPGLRDVLKLTPDAIRARIRTARGWHNMAKSNLKKT